MTPKEKQQKQKKQVEKASTQQRKHIKKIQSIEWEIIFVDYIFDKGFISNIYNKFIQFNSQKTDNQIKKKMGKRPE